MLVSHDLAEPWFSFLTDLDRYLTEPVDMHCIGGFVVSHCYNLRRDTADIDVLTVTPREFRQGIVEFAGRGSALQRKYGIYLDLVGVVNFPADYDERLVRAFPLWEKLRLWALEPHDLALTKIERSSSRDTQDVRYLAQAGLINRDTLVHRWETELAPYIVGPTPTWHQTTLNMWIDACWPDSPES